MICKLCKTEKPLLKHSHIIPEFMYKGLYNEKHFMLSVDLIDSKNSSYIPTGSYDSNILCAECDNEILGSIESYSSSVMLKQNCKDWEIEEQIDNNSVILIKNVDYKKFKLFMLSILWRASISDQAIFKHVSLGLHEERIRQMILDGNPGNEDEYPFGIYLLAPNKITPTKVVSNPKKVESTNSLSYNFLINGLILNFKIKGSEFDVIYDRLRIKTDNVLKLLVLNENNSVFHVDKHLNQCIRY